MNVLIELFWVFFKLGAFTVGGGIAMLPILQNSLIYEKKWFTEEEFVDAVAVCQGLPGVIAVNMATYVGYKKKGLAGSLVSTFAVVTPSFLMILIIAKFLGMISDNPYVQGAMAGFRVAALGLVVTAVIQLAPKVIKDKWTVAAAVLAFVLIAVFNVNKAYVILLFIVPAPAVLTLLLIISSLLSLFRRSEMSEALLLHFNQVKTPGTFTGLRALHHDLTSSSIRTIPLVPELHRFGCHKAVRGLYRQWGIAPRPEDLICCTIWTISLFYEFRNAAFDLFCCIVCLLLIALS